MQVKKYIYEFLDETEKLRSTLVENDNLRPVAAAQVVAEVVDNAPKPVYTEEQMQVAKTLVLQEGVRQGQEMAKAQFLEAESKKTEVLQGMIKRIELSVEEAKANAVLSISGVAERLKLLALAAARKANGSEGIEDFIKKQVEKLHSKGALKIFSSQQNVDMLLGKFHNAEVVAEESLTNSDFRIEWDGGFAERNMEEIWKEIEDILRK